MKKTYLLLLLPLLSTCTRSSIGIIQELKMYTDTWPSPTDSPEITDSAGYKTINITSHVTSKEALLILSSVYIVAVERGMTIQACILPKAREKKYLKVKFNFLVDGQNYPEEYPFFDSVNNYSIADKAKLFFCSVGAQSMTYKGQHDSKNIHFVVQWLDKTPASELPNITTPIRLFTRYCVLGDSARYFNKMFLHHYHTGETFPPTNVCNLKDPEYNQPVNHL
jgi:hypothetical protein